MDVLQHLMDGFAAVLTLRILLYALAGVVLGTLVGALPAFGPAAGIALLLRSFSSFLRTADWS